MRGFPAVILALLACFVAVYSAAAQSSLSSNRFLFVVDASAGMKPLARPTQETLFDLVYSGARGHMTNNDTYGVWLVSDDNDTSFPMDTWKSKHAVEMGARAGLHLKNRGFKGRARLNLAVADLLRVIKSVEDLTVILITNGETPISGTPFDADINAKFRELAPVMKRGKVTVNLVLVAQGGKLEAWAVNRPGLLLSVPYVPPRPKPVKVEVAATTNALPLGTTLAAKPETNSIATQTLPVAAPRPRSVVTPIVITKETVAQEKRSYQAMTAAAGNEPSLSTMTNIALADPDTNDTGVVTATKTNGPSLVVSNTVLAMTGTNNAVAATATASVPIHVGLEDAPKTNMGLETSATPPGKAPPTVVPAPAPVPSGGFHPLLWAAFGAGVAFICVLAGFIVARSRRQEPSLISQAIVQERLSRS